MRPNFFVNTPDILHAFLQYGGPPAFKIRAVLAAHGLPELGGVRRLRAVRARRGQAGQRGVPRLGEVPDPGPRLGRRGRRPAGRWRRTSPSSTGSVASTPPCSCCATSRSTAATTTTRWSSPRPRTTPSRRPRRHGARRAQPRPARHPRDDRPPRHAGARASPGTTRSSSRTSSAGRSSPGGSTTTCASTRTTSPPTSSPCGGPDERHPDHALAPLTPRRGPRMSEAVPTEIHTTGPDDEPVRRRPDRAARLVQDRGLLRGAGAVLPRRRRQRHRRLQGPDREARLPAVARASTACGCRRSSPRPCATAATTSPTTPTSFPRSARPRTSTSSSTRPTSATSR